MEIKSKLKIVNIDDVTYCKAQPIKEYNDFGAVAFFYCALKDIKEFFEMLEYYDLEEGECSVAV